MEPFGSLGPRFHRATVGRRRTDNDSEARQDVVRSIEWRGSGPMRLLHAVLNPSWLFVVRNKRKTTVELRAAACTGRQFCRLGVLVVTTAASPTEYRG
jgi:hypothetical protein